MPPTAASDLPTPVDLVVEARHRPTPVVELAIRGLKAGALSHSSRGDFPANSAWTRLAAIATTSLAGARRSAHPVLPADAGDLSAAPANPWATDALGPPVNRSIEANGVSGNRSRGRAEASSAKRALRLCLFRLARGIATDSLPRSSGRRNRPEQDHPQQDHPQHLDVILILPSLATMSLDPAPWSKS
jgi:hypothetical protein